MSDKTKLRISAMNLLSRREHSRAELTRKLQQRDHDPELIQTILTELEQENLQSDTRYTESYINMRARKGYGPQRIEQELHERGVSGELVNLYINESAQDWYQQAKDVRIKKFGPNSPENYQAEAKQKRFLQYRGFNTGQIRFALEPIE